MAEKDSVFGKLIAYVLPGFLALWVIASFDATAAHWLTVASGAQTNVGSFLFVMLASLGLGVFANGVRWMALDDRLYVKWGVPARPDLDEAKRKDHEPAYQDLREAHFRFHQFYGNTGVAGVGALIVLAVKAGTGAVAASTWIPLLVALLVGEFVLLYCGRDCLSKYRTKRAKLLGLWSAEAA